MEVASQPLQLENEGATCYLNSVLQVLLSCVPQYEGWKEGNTPLAKVLHQAWQNARSGKKLLLKAKLETACKKNLGGGGDARDTMEGTILENLDEDLHDPFLFRDGNISAMCYNEYIDSQFSFLVDLEGFDTVQKAFDNHLYHICGCEQDGCYRSMQFSVSAKFLILFFEHFLVVDSKSMHDHDIMFKTTDGTNYKYVLRALVDSRGGHAVAITSLPSPSTKTTNWFLCNDDIITPLVDIWNAIEGGVLVAVYAQVPAPEQIPSPEPAPPEQIPSPEPEQIPSPEQQIPSTERTPPSMPSRIVTASWMVVLTLSVILVGNLPGLQ